MLPVSRANLSRFYFTVCTSHNVGYDLAKRKNILFYQTTPVKLFDILNRFRFYLLKNFQHLLYQNDAYWVEQLFIAEKAGRIFQKTTFWNIFFLFSLSKQTLSLHANGLLKCQSLFSGTNKDKIRLVCCLLDLPREFQG